jgi:hypothetical protein
VTPAVPDQGEEKLTPPAREVFRSPAAVVIWWVWVLFAVGNLIDLAVQGRGQVALEAACTLLLITGIVYVSALRPRVIADSDRLTIVNPVSDHWIGWAAVAGADPTDLLRVRCAWPDDGGQTRRRSIYAWAVHSSRRRQVTAELRAERQARRAGQGRGGGPGRLAGGAFGGGAFGGGVFGGWGAAAAAGPGADPAAEPDPLKVDAGRVVTMLTERGEAARQAAPAVPAVAPASAYQWRPIAAVAVPVLLLLLVVLL